MEITIISKNREKLWNCIPKMLEDEVNDQSNVEAFVVCWYNYTVFVLVLVLVRLFHIIPNLFQNLNFKSRDQIIQTDSDRRFVSPPRVFFSFFFLIFLAKSISLSQTSCF